MAIASALAIGASLPEARDAHQHDTRIDRAHTLVIQPPRIEPPGTKVLDDNIRALDELQGKVASGRLAQVECDEPLIARLCEPPGGKRARARL